MRRVSVRLNLVSVLIWSLSFLLVTSSQVLAREGDKYILPKMTAMLFEYNPEKEKLLYSVGAVYGYSFESGMSMEIDGNYSVSGGEYTSVNGSGSIKGWDVGVSGAYRYRVLTEGYLKGKGGLSYINYEHQKPAGGTSLAQGAEFIIGGGFGYVFKSKITFELEYTLLKNHSDNLSLALHYPF